MSASCDAPAPSLTRRRADLQIESVRGRGVIALVARRVDVALSPGVDAARQAALVELGLDLIGIERGQAERDVTDCRPARRRRRAGPRAPVAAAATPDDDVADIADLALVLTALIGARLPTEKRGVERHGFLVVRHLERDVIEPDGLPVGRVEGRRRRRLAVRGPLTAVLPVAVADLQVEPVGILHVEALKVLALVIGHPREPALPQFRFHCLGVPRLDTPAET